MERQGYIYTIKGRGSFVADIGGILDVRREEWRTQLKKLAEEGYSLGIGQDEMAEIIREAEPAGSERDGKENGMKKGRDEG